MSNRYFHIPHREQITQEPDPAGRWSKQFPDMIGYKNQGGGKVPEDFGWNTNPKQWQEELTSTTLEKRFNALRTQPSQPAAPALPAGDKK
ncbi:hypothetical protein P2318_03965 [Myxococcaceae bacterium GXIMD 01537]